ncbi:MinD/ParA family protein [Caldalkalibacillus mannanilyticus]|uniref:MinD/ParA family protein n=1 Tax=Caldalkalibacillus mannanilyticus TaxID=1418 RepID=UPI00046B0599|nr:MinD/ParA family protein [Caldalkalibacillus mannanilyticus]
MRDQAEKLREQINRSQGNSVNKQTRIITVTSGKGGVGKSNFSLNFALSLLQQNKKVLIFDVDLGLANIDVLMGVSPRHNILQMIDKDLSIWDIVEEGPMGLQFIAGGSGFNHLFQLDERKLTKFFDELSSIHGQVDYVILDTGAGLSNENLRFILASDDVIVVTTPEPTSITDAYAVLKMIHSKDPQTDIKLVVNRCVSDKEGLQTARKLQLVAKQFLGKEVQVLGYIPDDQNVTKAVKKQNPFILEFPSTTAANAMNKIVQTFLNIPTITTGGIKGFLKKMFNKIG